jgi:hypothetical protein
MALSARTVTLELTQTARATRSALSADLENTLPVLLLAVALALAARHLSVRLEATNVSTAKQDSTPPKAPTSACPALQELSRPNRTAQTVPNAPLATSLLLELRFARLAEQARTHLAKARQNV